MIKRILLALAALVPIFIAYEWITWPDIARLRDEAPKTTAFMEERRRELRREGKDDTMDYQWVSYSRISPNLRRAVLVAEDNDFYEHGGVDMKAMQEAIKRDWKKKKLTHGGSTITQQLAKNLYLSASRNPLRKIKEYFLARSLENHLTKKRILELYLNVVEMGERVFGAEAAARHYFGKSAASLSPQEAALLAGCLPNPRIMIPGQPNKRLRWRQNMILSRMRRWGYIYEKEVLTAPKPEAPPQPPTEPSQPTDPDLEPPSTTDTAATTETSRGTTPPPPPPTDTTGTVPPLSATTGTAPPPSDTTGTH
ncbi:MAG TPA: monofunctional biosynthetic peptidoglycan transglycosylase [Thermoanaerobaculia bacterium]|nr:monofunctional biosynthetic peptidoglycan transglycosylase [Thermoanaerobaculia bacterium]